MGDCGFPDHHIFMKGARGMFVGTYHHTIDVKGRLIIPARFRDALGQTFMVSRGTDGCLYVQTREAFEEFMSRIAALPGNSKAARSYIRHYAAGACECELDKQGRIIVPIKLRQCAKLTKDVTLIGVVDRVEIWDSALWEAQDCDQEQMDLIEEQMREQGLTI